MLFFLLRSPSTDPGDVGVQRELELEKGSRGQSGEYEAALFADLQPVPGVDVNEENQCG